MVKRREDSPQAVTANRLADGIVVFLGPGGDWSARVADAAIAASGVEAAALLERATKDVHAALVVNPYLIAVAVGGAPTLQRERIRAHGPSIGLPGADRG